MSAAWQRDLAQALTRLHHRRPFGVAADAAVAELFELGPVALTRIDELIRSASHYSSPLSGTIAIDSLRDTPTLAQACLFVSACHRDGYVRQPALREFAAYPGALALSAALIRCDDWVAPVSLEAEKLLNLILLSDDSALFETLELALRLRSRSRYRHGVWTRLIEPHLRSPRHELARWQATAHPSVVVREWAYAAVRDCDPARHRAAYVAALNDPHPRIALPALRRIGEELEPAERDARLALGNGFKHFAVRMEALRLLQSFAIADAQTVLWTALLDRSPSVRGLAAYLLRTAYDRDGIALWRSLASGPDSANARRALMSLSSYGRIEDAELFVRWFAHPHPKLRKYALQGLILANAPQLAELIGQVLGVSDRRLFMTAFEAVSNGRAPMSAAALRQGWDNQVSQEFRLHLLQTTDALHKWEALEFLLQMLSRPESQPLRECIVNCLRSWSYGAAYRFGGLEPVDLQPLREHLRTAEAQLPTDLVDGIRAQLRASVGNVSDPTAE
ncbi:MAG: HEAT repeat domain-containing protein [Lysobacter sp.]